MIDDHQIDLTLLPGQTYQVADSGGYTYIYGIGGASVPEPSALRWVPGRRVRRCRPGVAPSQGGSASGC